MVVQKLVELVESRLSEELKDNKGAVLYDSWSKNSITFTAILVSYCAVNSKIYNLQDWLYLL